MSRVYAAIGDWFKEASVLVAVFGILDHMLRGAGQAGGFLVLLESRSRSSFSA